MSGGENGTESDVHDGRPAQGAAVEGGGEETRESDEPGAPSRYRDPITVRLGTVASAWESMHKSWQAEDRRADAGASDLEPTLVAVADVVKAQRDKLGKKLAALLKKHPLWPWLEEHPGVRGVHTARAISMIGDPLRFPGRKCDKGHHWPEDWMGDSCPMEVWDKPNDTTRICGVDVGPRRRGTGVRSVWHYFGLHCNDDGRAPRKAKGAKVSYRPSARTAVMQPDGIADQIVRHQVEPWIDTYYSTRERLMEEREILPEGADANNEPGGPLRQFQVHDISRKVAAKAFVGDLLMAWKGVLGY